MSYSVNTKRVYDVKIALNTILALIYQTKKKDDEAIDEELILQVLDQIKTPEQINEDDESSAISYLKGIILDSIRTNSFDKKSILKQLKLVTSAYPEYHEYADEYLSDSEDSKPSEEIAQHKKWLRNYINQTLLKKSVGKLYGSLNRNDPAEVEASLKALRETMETNKSQSDGKRKFPGLVSSLGTNNPKGFSEVFRKSNEVLSGAVFKTGFRGINRMFGQQNGIRMTELGLMPALPFNGKTLFSQSILLSMGVVNKAEDFDKFIPKGKIPMFLDLSLENGADVNIPQAFEMVFGNLERKAFDPTSIMTEQEVVVWKDETKYEKDTPEYLAKEAVKDKVHDYMAEYITSKLSVNGWHYQFDQYINSDFSIQFLPDIISDYESQGFHIMGMRGDYLGTIKKDNMGNGIGGSDIKELYRRARNCTAVKEKFSLLPHQLSTEAKRFRSLDPNNFIRDLPGRGLYEYCSSLDNEADWELFFGMRDENGRRFLEVKRGKHRHGGKTKSEDTYTVIPINPPGMDNCILPWDVLLDEELSKPSVSEFFGGGDGMGW